MTMVLRTVYVLCGLLSLLLAAPIVTEVLPFEIRTGQVHLEFWIIGVAVLLGLIGAPGYLYGLFRLPVRTTRSRVLWVRISLLSVLVASLIGIAGTFLLAAWLAFIPLISALSAIHLGFLTRLSANSSDEIFPGHR